MEYKLNSEAERLEFMIALTERSNTDGSLTNQLYRLTLAYLAEVSGIPYLDIIKDQTNNKNQEEFLNETTLH